ncbi:MAG TPA: hypothetical protein VGP84_17905, partial [Gemmatimonadaceae bacterium]|nr:hypothetical protein [Gemmatimonadaceae bacterium]
MKRLQWAVPRALFTALVAFACLATLHGQAPASDLARRSEDAKAAAHRIAVFGSSVANGTGDELGHEGYTGRLRAMLQPRGWEVLNQS